MRAPIILFVYNRPDHTLKTLSALKDNDLADQSELYIYSDGAKKNATDDQISKVLEVRKIIRSERWCKDVHIIESEINKGLADSIIGGVTEVVNKHGKIIVLEDDIVTSRGFLKYMNSALEVYQEDEKVMHISGFMYPYENRKLSETFFYPLPYPGGGWATWSRAWKHFNNDTDFLWNYFESKKLWKRFNTAGGKYFQEQLEMNRTGELKTWFVKWHGSVLIQNGLTLFPKKTLIYNSGFDGSGVHCGNTDEFNSEVVEYIEVKKQKVKSSKGARKIIFEFYQGKPESLFVLIMRRLKVYFIKRPKQLLKKAGRRILRFFYPQLKELNQIVEMANRVSSLRAVSNDNYNSSVDSTALCFEPYHIVNSQIDKYTYIAINSTINNTSIGRFCSIGPNLICGWGIHPTNGISTAPMFYSTLKQNGMTLSEVDKIQELKPIVIGNDVFIGANVTILDGVTIGDGAVIGAGAVVSKDIPPYAIAVGCPIRNMKYRFEPEQIDKLLKIKWWEFEEEKLKDVEKLFFDVNEFLEKHQNT